MTALQSEHMARQRFRTGAAEDVLVLVEVDAGTDDASAVFSAGDDTDDDEAVPVAPAAARGV